MLGTDFSTNGQLLKKKTQSFVYKKKNNTSKLVKSPLGQRLKCHLSKIVRLNNIPDLSERLQSIQDCLISRIITQFFLY